MSRDFTNLQHVIVLSRIVIESEREDESVLAECKKFWLQEIDVILQDLGPDVPRQNVALASLFEVLRESPWARHRERFIPCQN